MKDLQKRQQTLINLITRVGGRHNIQKWMDEILKIDIRLEARTMFAYKGYSILEAGDEAGLHFNGKKVQTDLVAAYRIDEFVELLDEHGLNWAARLRAEEKDPTKEKLEPTNEELIIYQQKRQHQQMLQDSFDNNEWKLQWREVFVAQTGTATERIPVYKHPAFRERHNLTITHEEDAQAWLAASVARREIQQLNESRFKLWVDHHFCGGIFESTDDEYSYEKWCQMEDIINENDYYSTSPEVEKARAYLTKYKLQGEADEEKIRQEKDRQIDDNYRLATEKILGIPGMKPGYLERMRYGIYLLGGDKGRKYRYADFSGEYCYNHIQVWHQSRPISGVDEITPEMISNAADYCREKGYSDYKKAREGKPVKSFEKWLQTVA
jgi:hypothetical protein